MSVLVTLDGVVRDPAQPLLFADDLAALRGDGIFETLLVRSGAACLLEPHLQRLAQSASMLDLAPPDPAAWRRAVGVAVRQWAAQTADDGVLRLVCSRGRESGSDNATGATGPTGPTGPTGYVMITAVNQRVHAARRDGVAAVLLQRGLPSAAVEAMPWLLLGAKTLSYAVNMAALREAARRGADDVVFVSSDGHILEGPRSTVVIATGPDAPGGRRCLLTPPPWYPILRGTTQHALFEVARTAGFDCDYRALRPADLFAAQGVWLVSAVTLAAQVYMLDGRLLAPSPWSVEVAALVEAAITGDR